MDPVNDSDEERAFRPGALPVAPSSTAVTAALGSGGLDLRSGAALGVGRRALYWLPVFAAMTVFAQVAFLGLRPALCEMERLTAAEAVFDERQARDMALRDQIFANLVARSDPIFLERQRRLARVSARDEP